MRVFFIKKIENITKLWPQAAVGLFPDPALLP